MRRALFLPLSLGGLLLLFLTFVYLKTQSVDREHYKAIEAAVASLKQLNTDLDQEMLQVRYGLVNHYDGMNGRLKALTATLGELHGLLLDIGKTEQGIGVNLTALEQTIRSKRQAIGDFMSLEALFKNSAHYFPGAGMRLKQLVRDQAPMIRQRLDGLLEHMLIFLLSGDSAERDRVAAILDGLRREQSRLTPTLQAEVSNLFAHATLLLDKKSALDETVRHLLSLPVDRRIDALYGAYSQYHDRQQQQARIYRMVLYVASLLLILYLMWLLFRLNSTTRTLRRTLDAMSQAQETLRLQASALEAAANAIIITDRQGVIQWVNQAFTRLTGYGRDEAVGRNPRLLNSGIHDRTVFEDLWHTILGGKVWCGEVVNRRKDGRLYVEEETITPVRDERGDISHFIAIKHDITERRHTERSLRRLNRALRVLSEANQVLVRANSEEELFAEICRIIVEVGGYRMAWVGMAEQNGAKEVRPVAWHGVDPAYLRSLDIRWDDSERGRGPSGRAIRSGRRQVVRDTGEDPLYAPWREAARRQGYASSIALPLVDGERVWGVLNIYAASDNAFDGEEQILLQELADDLQFGIKALQSHRERDQLQRQLQQAQKMEAIGQLTGGIAHDFNNILASIMGYTGLALERFAPDGEGKLAEYLAEVYRAGERARDLIAQMLAFSRSGANDASPLNLAPMVKEAVKLLGSTLPSSIEVQIEIGSDVPQVRIGPVQMHQIIMNLCINARDAMQGKGRLAITLRRTRESDAVCASCHAVVAGDYVELRIGDTGPGIKPEVVDSMFDPFYTTKDVGKGTGMGLSMVHGIVHEHGGHIIVETAPGEGALFRVLLPAAKEAGDGEGGEGQQEPAPDAGGRILIVDDEGSVAGFMAELLESHGYQAVTCADGRQALETFSADPRGFDLVITDQTMPGLTGAELAGRILALRPEIPIILCTGYSEYLDEAEVQKIGIRAYLAKPVPATLLLAEVNRLLVEVS
ncbi:GAF domain-containing protein [Thiohalobacter sp. IOR34]|uniref:DAHL domain-containing protein n=1 Tax=Thiohalobacter sp. IOR34 TaxID=3057176 RepID=UPI0025AF8BEB|nr:DAHL domain-containing protein [Thiohalobacter sp. IOR34]WJW74385.1 GAF domain-containing protein [Thiohalobacter sp. IOR34]